ncbi:uroporphyrinogen-III synthase [Tengunoibacter tsumagoiensis]|uniref:Tetrapyrrole biosynthesis uroporphyrinogen III synthase domain-containing protein n=1 Tax=Tengunoibacter tsumagoiensis TaxID=2014871 RepID=A0A401ZYQ6_9CHLR|nr:uroporphyrinogen-III synthase [Tengunoibacter tsumagoiensis]GCE11963.1 hypothetical protein KTT_18220 [Tengunoibacter tsumagoiensis]
MSSFNGTRIALLEARMSGEIANMIRRSGGEPVCAPALRESALENTEEIVTFIDHMAHAELQVVVFFTGVGVDTLFRVARELGRAEELLTALQNVTVVCRGPKPGAALKRLQIPITASASEPYTTHELLEAMKALPLQNTRVAVVHYGERNTQVIHYLQARGASIKELMLYEWLLPDDIVPLRALVADILALHIDAVVFTSQVQIRHLFLVAKESLSQEELAQALNTRTVVASIGPTCTATLREFGVIPRVEPQHPKIGHLIKALTDYLEGLNSN